jgi:GH24 family phage-related lysozyme (muramidase)
MSMSDTAKMDMTCAGYVLATSRKLAVCLLWMLGSPVADGAPANGPPPPICPAQASVTSPGAVTQYQCENGCVFEAPNDVEAEVLTEFEKYEGRVPYMYLDTRDNVTVGIGDFLPAASNASALPFYEGQQVRASSPGIENGYGLVKADAQPATCAMDTSTCRGSSSYRDVVDLTITDDDIDTVAKGQIGVFGDELVIVYPDFASYPSKVQLALYDMIFNLGQTKLQKSFPSFDGAIVARDWQTAANESHRTGIPQERNDYVKGLLEQAVSDGVAATSLLQQCPVGTAPH